MFFCILSICTYRDVVYNPSKLNIQRKIFKQKDQHFPQMSSLKRCKYIFFNSSNINCSTSFSISVIIDASFKTTNTWNAHRSSQQLNTLEQEITQQTDCLHDMALVKRLVNVCVITKMATAYLTLWKKQGIETDQNIILVLPTCNGITSITSAKLFWILMHVSRVLLPRSKQPKVTNSNLHMINPPRMILYLFLISLHTLNFCNIRMRDALFMSFPEVSHVGHCRKKSSGRMTSTENCLNHNKYWLCYLFKETVFLWKVVRESTEAEKNKIK